MGKGTGAEFANLVTYLKAALSCERKGEVNYLFYHIFSRLRTEFPRVLDLV